MYTNLLLCIYRKNIPIFVTYEITWNNDHHKYTLQSTIQTILSYTVLKEKLEYNHSLQIPIRVLKQSPSTQEDPFEHRSFKLKSTLNPVGPFQLESMFHSIEQDLHRQKYREPKKKNLTREEYRAIKSLKNNTIS